MKLLAKNGISVTISLSFISTLFKSDNVVHALSFPIPDAKGYYDRFRASCPADLNCIHQFNPSLVDSSETSKDDVWAAVYRSSNNMPSVFLKDDFMNAMDLATSTAIMGNNAGEGSANPQIETKEGKSLQGSSNDEPSGVTANAPVAVARMRPVGNKFIIDTLRCSLKKEETNSLCDGGSEHTEALSICIDELILEHLTRQTKLLDGDQSNGLFENALRCKATLVAAPLFEARGFTEVKELSSDMATHTSTLDASMERYAARVADITNESVVAKSPGSRDRALKILSLLGQLDSEKEKKGRDDENASGEEEEYDPWASVKKFI